MTRLTNAFSKKRRNLGAAVALHFMWYNFVRIHESLRVTPAYAAGLTDHCWDVEELVRLALAEPEAPPAPLAPIPSPDGWRPAEQLSLPGMAPYLLPPSVGGPKAANENADPPPSPEVEEEAPTTVRDPMQWATLQEGPRSVG